MGSPIREASIVLPTTDNDNNLLTEERADAERYMIASFGGFTRIMGAGGWNGVDRNAPELVHVYTLAMEPTAENYTKLYKLALTCRRTMRQQAIYVRLPLGEVEIVTAPEVSA